MAKFASGERARFNVEVVKRIVEVNEQSLEEKRLLRLTIDDNGEHELVFATSAQGKIMIPDSFDFDVSLNDAHDDDIGSVYHGGVYFGGGHRRQFSNRFTAAGTPWEGNFPGDFQFLTCSPSDNAYPRALVMSPETYEQVLAVWNAPDEQLGVEQERI